MVSTALVLGAGLGARLRPLTLACPKPLLPLRGRPMVEYVFAHLADSGVRRFIVNTHHAAERWARAFPKNEWRGLPLLFRHEPLLLGTAGGLKNVADLIGGETIFLHSGDVVTDLPLAPLLAAHAGCDAEVTLALRDSALKTVGLDTDGVVRRVGYAADTDLAWHDYANVAIVSARFLQRIPDTRPRELASVWRGMTGGGALRGTVINSGEWHNIGTPEEYEKFNQS
ncbi:MAG: NTP transferase domain-containing protein [Verrucomicrobiales bacterium]|jgi:NDP-sugar pyrophosphorylase family protein|nr:NTP transferase domain-containing protein [Verrucomicrobiales bacterium]